MKKFKFYFVISVALSIASCGTVKEGFSNNKKNNSDEFLVEKKSPLVMPPEFNELPTPNERKLHKNKISLLGGLLILLSLILVFIQSFFTDNTVFEKVFSFSKLEFYYLFFTCILVFLIGFFDDKKGL